MSPPQADADQLLPRFLGILPSTSEETILRMLIELGCEVMGAEEGSLLVYDKEEDVLRFVMTIGNPETEAKLKGERLKLGTGLTGLAAATREVQIGAPTYREFTKTHRESDGSAPEAVIAAPMVLADELIGVLTAVSFKHGKRFSSKDARLYAGFAAIAAVVVDLRRRLSAFEAGAAAAPAEETERAKLERRMLASVQTLVGGDPERLPVVADLLSAIEKVMALPPHEQ